MHPSDSGEARGSAAQIFVGIHGCHSDSDVSDSDVSDSGLSNSAKLYGERYSYVYSTRQELFR